MPAATQDSDSGPHAADGPSGVVVSTGAVGARERGGLRPTAAVGAETVKQQHEASAGPQQLQQQQRPLSFGRWFAREARATDIIFVLAEVLLINWLHAMRLGEAQYCGGGGSEGAAGSNSGSGTFPCGGGLRSKLIWSLVSGAILDPVLRLRQWDYGNLLYTCTQLPLVLIALLAPALYQRCRHVLMGGVSAIGMLGAHWSLSAAPAGPFPFNSVMLLSAERHRVAAVYLGWKSATVFRVPASVQRVTGPLLWLLTVTAMPLADRRMPPPGTAISNGGSRIAVHSMLLFLVIAVLPHLLCRFWETRTLRPAYSKYLRHCARAAGPGTAGGGAAGCGDVGSGGAAAGDPGQSRSCTESDGGGKGAGSSSAPTCFAAGAGTANMHGPSRGIAAIAASSASLVPRGDAATSPPPCYAGDPLSTSPRRSWTHDLPRSRPLAAMAAATWSLSEAAAAAGTHELANGGQASVLYRRSGRAGANGLLGRSHTALVSVKVPIRHCGSDPGSSSSASGVQLPTFEEASAAVLRSATSALDSHNRWRQAGLAAPGADDSAAGSIPPAAPMPSLRCLSAVCVEGCVQLLMVLHFVAAGDDDGIEGQEQQHVQLSPPQMLHVAVEEAAGNASAADSSGGPAAEPTAAAAAAAVQQLLAQVGAEQRPAGDAAAATTSASTASSAADASSTTVAGADVSAAAAGASGNAPASSFCWPPALPLLPTPDGAADADVDQAEAEVVTVLLQVPAASARGLRSVRCVLAGPAAQEPARPDSDAGGAEGSGALSAVAVAHVDTELPLHLLLPQPLASGGEGGGSEAVLAHVRLPVPRRARMGPAGLRMLHVLPPPPPPAHDPAAATGAAAEDDSPFTAAIPTISPAWLAAGHGGDGQPADALAGAPSSACSTAAVDIMEDTSAAANTPSASTDIALSNTDNAARSSMSGGPGSTAPLAVVPLLVVGPEAAAELQQLHGEVLGAAAVTQLQHLTIAAVADAAVPAPEGGSSSGGGDGEALPGAAAVQHLSGLTSLVLDFGVLLQLPRSYGLGGACEEGVVGEPAAAGYGGLLRFLAAQRMAGCLREALTALERAGMRLLLPPGTQGAEGGAVAAAAAGGGSDEQRLQLVPAATAALQREAQGVRSAQLPRPAGATSAVAGAAAAAWPDPLLAAGSQQPSSAPAAGADINQGSDASCKTATDGSRCAGLLGASAAAIPSQPGGPLPARLVWWLRVLALGFPCPHAAVPTPSQQGGSGSSQPQQATAAAQSSPSPEAAYQAYKAASCRPLDCMSIMLYTAFRVVTTIRTYTSSGLVPQLVAASAAAGGASAAAVVAGRGLLAAAYWRATQRIAGATQPLLHATFSCPRPYLEGRCGGLTDIQLQLLAQFIYLAVGVAAVVLATCTRLHVRRRNAFLLLRAGLDAAAFMTITLPLPRWPAPLLGVPQAWRDSNRQANVHWLVFGLYEPLTLQLSPYLQALQALIFVLPLTLLGYHSSDCRWRPALCFGFGHALLALAVSAATDARSRLLYMARRAQGASSRS